MERTMASTIQCAIPDETAEDIRTFYKSLGEKDRRRFAAVEAKRLGYGGIEVMAQLLGCSRSTISIGLAELAKLADGDPVAGRVRRPGGGRKKKSTPTRSSKLI